MTNRVGQQLGNYRLINFLGEGGFAEVYLGEHIHLGTLAAIKVLRTQLSAEDVEHFRSEARIIARLEHPNIVRVLDFGVEDKVPFLVMSYAPRGTLRQLHPRGTPLPLPTIVSYVKQIADALQYAHGQKLIHRDIKPENMLVGKRDEVLLSDFGIALVAQSSRYQTTRDVVGTVAYMSPEQIQGKPVPASDQYSLGVVVYEWISGTRPFQGTFTEIAVQHAVVPPPSLRERFPAISPDVEQVIMTALAKDARYRFTTVQAFANALEQASISRQSYPFSRISQPSEFVPTFVPGRQIESTVPATPSIPASQPGVGDASRNQPEPARRNLSRRLFLLSIAGITVAGGGFAWWELAQKNSHVVASNSSGSHRTTASPTSPATTPSAATTASLGAIEYIYHGHSASVGTVAWSPPDGQRIASGSGDNTVQVWDAASGGNVLVYRGHAQAVQSVMWSPDGQRIVSGGNDRTVQIWDAATGNTLFTYTGHRDTVWAVAWSPGGKYIASASSDRTVQVWDATTGNPVYSYQGHAAIVYAVAWSMDSTRIASAGEDQTVQIWDSTAGSNVLTYTHHSGLVTSVVWSPDGTQIASGAHDKTVQVWNPTTGNTIVTCYGHFGQVDSVVWSSDGTRLVSGSTDRTAIIWSPTTGKSLYIYRGHSASVWCVAWSPNGKHVASGADDRTVQIWLGE